MSTAVTEYLPEPIEASGCPSGNNGAPHSAEEWEAEFYNDAPPSRPPPDISTEGETAAQPSAVIQLLQEREFNPHIEPPPLRPIYTLNGVPIATPGNLGTITSAIKTGKSAVIGAGHVLLFQSQ